MSIEILTEKIEWFTEKRRINELMPYSKNPRIINDKQSNELKQSLKKFNLAEIPAINKDNTEEITEELKEILGVDTLGRKRIFYYQKCKYCGKLFKTTRFYSKYRKYCSQHCFGKVIAINNIQNYFTKEDIIKRNKSQEHIKKVRLGLKEHYKNCKRKNEKWYIEKYGENYIPKKLKYINEWKNKSKILREKYNCHRCNSREQLDVHHIIPFAISKNNSILNLVVLCRKCHKIVEDNNWGLFRLLNDWNIVRSCFRNNFLDIGKPIWYSEN